MRDYYIVNDVFYNIITDRSGFYEVIYLQYDFKIFLCVFSKGIFITVFFITYCLESNLYYKKTTKYIFK